jgi:hypothetical protein
MFFFGRCGHLISHVYRIGDGVSSVLVTSEILKVRSCTQETLISIDHI